jgi:small subunit ribosomal protein S27e
MAEIAEMAEMDLKWNWHTLMDIEAQTLTWCCLNRFSQSISSTQPQPLRLANTSSRYASVTNPQALYIGFSAEADFHPLQNLVPAPRSFFMDVKCPGCFTITTVFSHAQTVVICAGCSTVLCQPTGGKARLTEGCSFRRK